MARRGKSKVVVKDFGFKEFMRRAKDVSRAGKAKVRVGVLEDSAKGQQRYESGITVAELAAVLHFGTQDGRIPARPFLTMTFDAKREELKELGAKLLAGVIFGKLTTEQALNMMGAKLAADVRKTITDGVPPPNAPSTLINKALKGKGVQAAFVSVMRAEVKRHKGITLGGIERLAGGKHGPVTAEQYESKTQKLHAAVGRAWEKANRKFQDSIDKVKPLIDTGRLLGSITWMVEREKK